MQNTTPSFSRRTITRLGLGLGAAAVVAPLWAQATPKVIRIGYQKFNTLNILKGTGNLEKALAPLGIKVEWHEFLGGGQLAEALAAGAIDFGHAADGIGVFQQASGKGLVYLAAESPYPGGVGFLVPKDSPIKSIKDLNGKTVATTTGTTSVQTRPGRPAQPGGPAGDLVREHLPVVRGRNQNLPKLQSALVRGHPVPFRVIRVIRS